MRILNLGSLNIDHVYKVDHFVQPGETISSLELNDFCGGKGLNQSVAAARAGAEVFHAGMVGPDGDMLLEMLNQSGANTDYVKQLEDVPTGHAIIQVNAKGQNCIIIHGGANRAVTTDYIDDVLGHFSAGDILLLQNEVTNIEYAIDKAKEKGMRVALNPSPIDDALAKSKSLFNVDWFILNEIEGNALTGKKLGEEICEELLRLYPDSHVVLTLGKQGVIYFDKAEVERHGIYDVPVVDTTAAGDTFTGYFLAGVVQGMPTENTLEMASKASSLAVSRAGAAPSIPTRAEVDETAIKLDLSFMK